MQDMREIPAIVNEKIVIKFVNFHTFGGGTSVVMSLANRRTDSLACLEQLIFHPRQIRYLLKKTARL